MFRIGGALDEVIGRVVEGLMQPSLDPSELGNGAVVHPQEAVVLEGMAVEFANREPLVAARTWAKNRLDCTLSARRCRLRLLQAG